MPKFCTILRMDTIHRVRRGEALFARAGDRGLYVGRVRHDDDTARHDHLFYELVYVEAGHALHVGADETREIGRGDVIVIRPGVWHAYHQADQLSIVNCLIQPQLLYRLAGWLDDLIGTFELLRKPASADEGPTVISTAGTQEGRMVSQLLSGMIHEQEMRDDGYETANIASLHQILVATVRLYQRQRGDQPHPPATAADQAVLKAVDYLQRHCHDAVSLDGLADRVHISAAHLSRSFSKRVGMGVVQFIHRLRAEEACRLLSMSGLQVGQIATRVGYDEVAYFSRCFKQQIGVSPKVYRHRSAHGD